MRTPNVFAGGFDRLAERRGDLHWLEARRRDPAALVTPFIEGRPLLVDSLEGPRLAGIPAPEVAPGAPLVLLGLIDGRVRFATPASDDAPPVEGARFADARESGALLPGHEAAALAMARGLLLWHEATRFCTRCGSPVRVEQAGHLLRCTSEGCGVTHHPRIEPSIITLVTDGGERCILGRSRRHPPGMHSCFAGFVEPGESLEDAVVREVREEIGVRVADVEYHSSQPWPFPAALMLGFIAHTGDDEIRMEDGDGEILEARWFSRGELLASPEDDTLRLPRASSIARRMVEDWLRGRA